MRYLLLKSSFSSCGPLPVCSGSVALLFCFRRFFASPRGSPAGPGGFPFGLLLYGQRLPLQLQEQACFQRDLTPVTGIPVPAGLVSTRLVLLLLPEPLTFLAVALDGSLVLLNLLLVRLFLTLQVVPD